jgi:hypothetical protein
MDRKWAILDIPRMPAEKRGPEWKRSGAYLALGVVERPSLNPSSGDSNRGLALGGKASIHCNDHYSFENLICSRSFPSQRPVINVFFRIAGKIGYFSWQFDTECVDGFNQISPQLCLSGDLSDCLQNGRFSFRLLQDKTQPAMALAWSSPLRPQNCSSMTRRDTSAT